MAEPTPRPLRVVVADDQTSVREGLVLLLDLLPGIDVVGSASNGRQAVEQVASPRRDPAGPVHAGAGRRRGHPPPHRGTSGRRHRGPDHLRRRRLGPGDAARRCPRLPDADRLHIARTLHSAAAGLAVLDPKVQATLLATASMPARAPHPEGRRPHPPRGGDPHADGPWHDTFVDGTRRWGGFTRGSRPRRAARH